MIVEIIRNGKTFYLHTAWANEETKSDLSLTEIENAIYIGNYIDRSAIESEAPYKYKWTENHISNGESNAVYEDERIDSIEALAQMNAEDIASAQMAADISIGNPNLLLNTNEGITNYTVSPGYSIEECVDSVGENENAIRCIKITCTSQSDSGALYFNAANLRTTLENSVEENTYTLSLHTRMSELFEISRIAVQNIDGSNPQLIFEPLSNTPNDDEITMDDEWAYYESTTQYTEVEADEQILCLSLSNMPQGATLVIANLKIEAGATATPWRESVEELSGKVKVIKEKVIVNEAQIDELKSKSINTDNLSAEVAKLGYASIEELEAKIAEFGYLKTDDLEAEVAEFGYLKTDELETEVAEFGYAKVENLNTNYARLDQANINQAWVMDLMVTGNFLADDFNAATGSFSKYLTGVKILGDLIEANTLKANTLILQGEDGIYRRLNIDALGQAVVDSDPKYNQGIDGSVLVKESITADKINVTDLFAQNITATGSIRGLSIIGGTIMGTLGEIGAFKLSPSGLESRLSAEAIYDWSEMDFAEGMEITTPYNYTVGRFTDFYKVDSLTEITFSAEGVSLGDNIPTLAYANSNGRYGKMEDISDYKIQLIEIRKMLIDGGYAYNITGHDITTEPQTITVPEAYDQVAFGIGIYATGMCGKDTATSLSYASHYLLWGYDTLYPNYEYTVQALVTTIKPRVVIKGIPADVSINPFGFKYGGFFVTNNGDVFLDDSELEALWAENVEV